MGHHYSSQVFGRPRDGQQFVDYPGKKFEQKVNDRGHLVNCKGVNKDVLPLVVVLDKLGLGNG
jgi:hypothetical protein